MEHDSEQRILITQAAPGMVLSRPVSLANGARLCGVGTQLSDDLIQRLTIRGIKRIFVRGQPVPSRSAQPFEQRLAALRQRFSRVRQRHLMAQLERAIEKQMTYRP